VSGRAVRAWAVLANAPPVPAHLGLQLIVLRNGTGGGSNRHKSNVCAARSVRGGRPSRLGGRPAPLVGRLPARGLRPAFAYDDMLKALQGQRFTTGRSKEWLGPSVVPHDASAVIRRAVRYIPTASVTVVASSGVLSWRQRPVNRGTAAPAPAFSLSTPQPAVWWGDKVSSAASTSTTRVGSNQTSACQRESTRAGRSAGASGARRAGRAACSASEKPVPHLPDRLEPVGGLVVDGQQQRPVHAGAPSPAGQPAHHHQVQGVGQLGAVVALELDPLPAARAGLVVGGGGHRLADHPFAALGHGLLEHPLQAGFVADLFGGGQPQPSTGRCASWIPPHLQRPKDALEFDRPDRLQVAWLAGPPDGAVSWATADWTSDHSSPTRRWRPPSPPWGRPRPGRPGAGGSPHATSCPIGWAQKPGTHPVQPPRGGAAGSCVLCPCCAA
jgi:hypothetical protein